MPDPQKMKDMMGELEETTRKSPALSQPSKLEIYLAGLTRFDVGDGSNVLKNVIGHVSKLDSVNIKYAVLVYIMEPIMEPIQNWGFGPLPGSNKQRLIPVPSNYDLSNVGFKLSGPGIKEVIPGLTEDILTIKCNSVFELTLLAAEDSTYDIQLFNNSHNHLYFRLDFSTGLWTVR